jgi:hypothetical protein
LRYIADVSCRTFAVERVEPVFGRKDVRLTLVVEPSDVASEFGREEIEGIVYNIAQLLKGSVMPRALPIGEYVAVIEPLFSRVY